MMITQREIAARLGVSQSLVSHALAGTAEEIGAATETIRRIREEATRLNYRPNAVALTLRGTPTKTIGVIVKNFDDPYFGRMIAELQGLAWSKQYSLLLTGYARDKEQPVDAWALSKYHLDGIVVAGSDFGPFGLTEFLARGIPIVQLGTGKTPKGVVQVTVDEKLGLRQLVDYLKKLGHRDFGFVGDDTPSLLRREALFREVAGRCGLAIRPNASVIVPAPDSDAGYRAMRQLLRQCGELLPTAVVSADDVIAQGAMRALFERKIQVPGEMSLAGIDDIPSARMTIPGLTTVRQPMGEMVNEAFQILTGASERRGNRIVKPELVIRESCAGRKT